MRKFLSEWQEVLAWIPGLLVGAYLCLRLIPRLDPTAGVDGLGFISGLVQAATQVAVIFFLAWLYRRTYGHTTDDEYTAHASVIRREHPVLFYIFEKLEKLVIFLAVLYCIKG